MAKTDTDEAQKIDEETLEQLEQVKKGKPRKFVLITKGASVISLVVYKKGNVEKFKKEAKKSGRGVICYGKIEGKAMDIAFHLAVSDGFDKEPVKPNVLRSYLEESGDFKCKPRFEIVETAGVVLDEDDPLVIQYRKLQKIAESKQNELAASGADNQVKTLCRQIEGYLDEDQDDQAKDKLFDLETVLNVKSAPTVEPEEDLTAVFTKRLKELVPKIEKASDNKEVVLLGKLARELAQKKDFRQALKALDKLEEKLKYAPAGEDKAATVVKGQIDKQALTNSLKDWQKARQIVDQQVSGMLAALRSADYRVLREVAKECEPVSSGFKPLDTALITAIQKLTQAPSNDQGKKAAEVARQIVAKYQTYIDTNRLIEAAENNPLNVDVSVRVNLGLGLAHLDKSLAAAVAALS
jgi:hypothetical protein